MSNSRFTPTLLSAISLSGLLLCCSCAEKSDNQIQSSQSDTIASLRQQLTQEQQKLRWLIEADPTLVANSESKPTKDTALIVPAVASKPVPAQPSAQDQWTQFRNNEDKYIGSKVKWRVQVDIVFGPGTGNSPPTAYVDGTADDECLLRDQNGDQADLNSNFPAIHNNDWLMIEGIFRGLDRRGAENIWCSKISHTNTPNGE